jgi:RNA polymerase sigma-70 factor (ECF subfamily)
MDDLQKNIPDEDVVISVQNGDRDAFATIVKRYQSRLTRYGKKFLVDRSNIDDVVQDVFISAYENINSFNTSLQFSSWVYRIAHNAFINEIRRKKRYISIPEFDFDELFPHFSVYEPYDENEHKEMKKLVDMGLSELPEKYREVLVLHYIEDQGYKEISDILKIPVGTVGIRIKRAKEEFRKRSKEEINKYKYGTKN